MKWIAFSYSLPSKEGSSPRVAVWRRLRHWGSLAIAGSVQILPDREECLEAFQWLAQEIRANNGEATIMRVTELEELTDQQLIAMFRAARVEDYRRIEAFATDLTKNLTDGKEKDISQVRDKLNKLRRHYADILRIDYFECPEGRQVASFLNGLGRSLSPAVSESPSVTHADIAPYQGRRWVTRPHPYVDRMACAWLIRRFINPQAAIRYSHQSNQDEVAFDMNQGEFGHRGNLCTFETMIVAFELDDPALQPIAEMVHEIDLHDDRYIWPEITGIERLINGWSLANLSDTELEENGISLFEGLYLSFSHNCERK